METKINSKPLPLIDCGDGFIYPKNFEFAKHGIGHIIYHEGKQVPLYIEWPKKLGDFYQLSGKLEGLTYAQKRTFILEQVEKKRGDGEYEEGELWLHGQVVSDISEPEAERLLNIWLDLYGDGEAYLPTGEECLKVSEQAVIIEIYLALSEEEPKDIFEISTEPSNALPQAGNCPLFVGHY